MHHPALELLEGDARTNARSRVIRTYARLARTGEERWLSPRPASYPTQQPSQQQQQQQHWEETWALHALAGRVRRRYFAECGLTQRRALSVALARMLRQPLPMPDAPSRLLYRTQVLRLSADPRGEGDAEDGPVLQPHGSPRAILLRACFLPSSSSSTPKCRAGCLAPSPRASLVMPYLGAADREAIAAAVLGPVRQREKRLLASSFSGLVALSREEVVGLAKVLASLGDGDVEALQAMLAAGGTEAKPEPGPAEEESTAASLSQGGEEEAQLQKEVEPLALVPSYALEVIVELRGPAPPRESWCMFEGRRMVAARLRKHKEPATATAAGSAGNPSTASCTPVTAKRASAGAPRIKDEQHAAEEGEAPPFFPAQQPPLSPREDPHVTWADPLVEMEMAAAPSPQGSSRSSSTTSTTSSGDPPAVVSRRYRPSRRALVVGLAAMLVVGLIAVLVAVLWKERPPARPIKQEAIAESEVKGGGRRLPTPAPVESREPLTYAEWQELARGRWGDVGYPRVGKAGQTVAQLVEGAASARDWILYEAMGAFDPAWRPGRHFRMSPEFRQYHDQWAAAVGAGRVKGWK